MKLPEKMNLYKHNESLEDLHTVAQMLLMPHQDKADWKDVKIICTDNLRRLKKISAIITHLELAIDEVLKKLESESV